MAVHGGVSFRVLGRSVRLESGEAFPLDRLPELAAELASGSGVGSGTGSGDGSATGSGDRSDNRSDSGSGAGSATGFVTGPAPTADDAPPLFGLIRRFEATFRAARAAADVAEMVETVLALDDELWAWSADTLQSDALDRGRAGLRAMVAELGELAAVGARDPAGV